VSEPLSLVPSLLLSIFPFYSPLFAFFVVWCFIVFSPFLFGFFIALLFCPYFVSVFFCSCRFHLYPIPTCLTLKDLVVVDSNIHQVELELVK
jgi:hypothetical protein